MRLICKDTNKGSITFFTKGKYAFRGVNRNDTTDDVPDPILDVNNYNESIQFHSKTPGMCEVDWGDGNKDQFPFVKDRSESIYGRYKLMFRRRDISYRKNPDSHPWWFYKEDGSEYIPAPNHAYADGLDKDRVITMTFTNDITYVRTARIMMVGFPILDAPSIINLTLSITGDGNITDIPKDRIRRSVNIEYIALNELGAGTLTSIPDDWDRLTKLRGINLSRTADFNDTESSNIRKFPSMWPNLVTLALAGCRVRVYPREWLSFSKLRELYISPGVAMPSFDPNTCPAMDEVDKINPNITDFYFLDDWVSGERRTGWNDDNMSGRGLEHLTSFIAAHSNSLRMDKLPDYIYEMRAITWFNVNCSTHSQQRSDDFVDSFYKLVTEWDQITMTSVANDGKRNQFYGLSVSMYTAAYPTENQRPSGTEQAPEGFVKGSSNGFPATPMEKIYVLKNNYAQRWTIKPE